MACNSTLLDRLSNSNNFSTWKTTTINSINAITSDTTQNNKSLQMLETDITNTLSCAQQRFTELSKAPSNITRLESDIIAARATLTKTQNDGHVAKERTKLITNPEKHTTVYEGWFPIFRPLQMTTMLILIGLALFFTSLSLGFLTNLLGFHLQLGYEIPYVVRPGGAAAGIFTPLTLGVGTVIITLVFTIIYAFTRKA